MTSAAPDPSQELPAPRTVGGFELGELLGRSRRSMAWRARDLASGQAVLLVLPRVAPSSGNLPDWAQAARKAQRLDHPQLLRCLQVVAGEGWPFAVYEDPGLPTLAQRMEANLTPRDAAHVAARVALGLAFAHDATVAHGDVQPWLILAGDSGKVLLFGLEIGTHSPRDAALAHQADALDASHLQVRRALFRRDVVSLGMVLHEALAGRPPLDEPDATEAASKLPPAGRETVRLPWLPQRPLPTPLRQFVDRATDRQPMQRFQSARTAAQALEGWLDQEALFGADVLKALGDRVASTGLLPSADGGSRRLSRLSAMDGRRTQDLADIVLEDPALTLELLRQVNLAQGRSSPALESGPVVTVRRAIALLGVQQLRRAALSLKPWPGTLGANDAARLARLLERCRTASRLAEALRPPGFDAELVYLATLLQNLGRLVLAYHFPSESLQIEALATGRESMEIADPGHRPSEAVASLAVMGIEPEAVGTFVVRSWGLGDQASRMMRRIAPDAPIHAGASDDEVLRATASCANDAMDALELQPRARDRALAALVQHYGPTLALTEAGLRRALTQVNSSLARPTTVAGGEGRS